MLFSELAFSVFEVDESIKALENRHRNILKVMTPNIWYPALDISASLAFREHLVSENIIEPMRKGIVENWCYFRLTSHGVAVKLKLMQRSS